MIGSAGVRCLLFGVIIFEAAICSAADDVVVNTLEMKLKRVAAGQFAMGSPASEERRRSDETQRKVVISRPFFMATTEVTQSQWFALMKTKPWA
ncbi:MAG: SUMF1/EgtB/PvdO family nonheme iron enzyme, partial [bacterium]|nr:SUMF1/EgtB/PvdO family nonheme iron enzyme [bacterium]